MIAPEQTVQEPTPPPAVPGRTARRGAAAVTLGFALSGLLLGWMALRLPVFNPVDELYHYDYILKLARGERPRPTAAVEPDLIELGALTMRASAWEYMGKKIGKDDPRGRIAPESYEAYHPPLFYWAGAALVRGAAALGLDPLAALPLVRLFCAAMLLASRVLLFLALARFGWPVALAALPYLWFMVPVDLLRVSNDTPVVLFGALAFWLLVRPIEPGRSRRRAITLGLTLLAAVAVKLNALLYLAPALALCLALPRPDRRFTFAQAALIFVPALALAAELAAINLLRSGGLTGTAHLATSNFPAPIGIRLRDLVPTAQKWMDWHNAMLMVETLVRGRREFFPHQHLVTIITVGRLAAVGVAIWGVSAARAAWLGWTPERQAMLRRYVWAGLAAVAVILMVLTALWGLVGRAFFQSSRLLLPVEFLMVLPAAAGWAWMLAGPSRDARALRRGCWFAAAILFAAASWPYVKLVM